MTLVAQKPYDVLVIEDDQMVAGVHCRVVRQSDMFRVVGISRTEAQARRSISVHKPDLLLLDVGLPGGDGLSLLRDLRAQGSDIEVIVVTAGAAGDLVRSMMHLGVVDYLVKPFSPQRLRQALWQFHVRMTHMRPSRMQQGAIDALRTVSVPSKAWIPRDLSPDRLDAIRGVLADADGPLSSDEVAAQVDVARVTARRYLEYLVTIQEAECTEESGTRGRPRKFYTHIPQIAVGGASLAD
ncbi:MAG TPA: response regulator [Trebonia sp.]|jgi:response regulator of citrate/malate metabolism|nr:response regulator [Trebonia sp.]